MYKMLHSVMLTLFLVILAGCAVLQNALEKPDLSVTSINLQPIKGMEATFNIGLRVSNPNAVPLPLAGMAYTLNLEGFEVIKGVANDLSTISAYSEKEFTVSASTNLLQSIRLLSKYINAPKGSLDYSLDAELDTGNKLISPFNLSTKGNIGLTQQTKKQ